LWVARISLYRSRPRLFRSLVEPSISVNRKVTVPVGSFCAVVLRFLPLLFVEIPRGKARF
jgi:hypothetical protein